MSLLHRLNLRLFVYILGVTAALLGFTFLPSALYALVNEPDRVPAFLLSSGITFLISLIFIHFNKNFSHSISKKDGRLIVAFIWLFAPILGCLPYMFCLDIFYSPINALFESFSGFTTTGATVIDSLTDVPRSILLYRSLTQWLGGLGLTIIIILLVTNFRNSSNYLFNAEFTSLDKEKVSPHIKSTVMRIIGVYLSLTLLAIVLLSLGDMNFFTALCHSFSTVSTGGFTTVNGSIGQFSAYTQWVTIVLMFISSLSYFSIYWIVRGKGNRFFIDEQTKVYTIIIIIASVIIFSSLYFFHSMPLSQSIRLALFHSVSASSTTGYEFVSASNIGFFSGIVIMILMFIGGCSASSATGLKIIRVIILFKYTLITLKRMFHPRAVLPMKYNHTAISEEASNLVFGFFFLYLLIFVFGAFTLTIFGNDFVSSISMALANISNTGGAINVLSPGLSYESLNIFSKITLITLMILGRLEIYSFLALFSRTIWLKS
jgi:Trk-type K+ transport systems, membrane components